MPQQERSERHQSQALSKLLIVAAATMWGISFFVLKDAIAALPVFFVLALRFCGSAVLLLALFWRHFREHLDRRTIRTGITLGAIVWAGYAFQTIGLTMTTPGKNAFISGCYCVLVPFVSWAVGLGRPERYNVVAAFLCVVGLGLVGVSDGLPLNEGDVLSLACAFFYALQYAFIAREGGYVDVWALSIWEFLVMGALSLGITLAFEPAPSPAAFTLPTLGSLAYLTVFASAGTLCATNYAFATVDPREGALLSSLEAPIGVAASVLAGYEVLTGRIVAGFVLIFVAIAFSEMGPRLVGRPRRKR